MLMTHHILILMTLPIQITHSTLQAMNRKGIVR
jgi:hypothetical protein